MNPLTRTAPFWLLTFTVAASLLAFAFVTAPTANGATPTSAAVDTAGVGVATTDTVISSRVAVAAVRNDALPQVVGTAADAAHVAATTLADRDTAPARTVQAAVAVADAAQALADAAHRIADAHTPTILPDRPAQPTGRDAPAVRPVALPDDLTGTAPTDLDALADALADAADVLDAT